MRGSAASLRAIPRSRPIVMAPCRARGRSRGRTCCARAAVNRSPKMPIDARAVGPSPHPTIPGRRRPPTRPAAASSTCRMPSRPFPGNEPSSRTPRRGPSRSAIGASVRRGRDPLRPALIGALVVALLAATVVVGAQLVRGGGGEVAAAPERDGPEVLDSTDPPTTSTSSSTTAPPLATSTTTTSTTVPTTTSTSRPPNTTSTTVGQASSGSAPRLAASFSGGWVAQLSSVPASATASEVDAAWQRVNGSAPGAVVTRSDEWSSLSPGYWVILDPGPFASADEARSFCARIQRDCLPRELSGRR